METPNTSLFGKFFGVELIVTLCFKGETKMAIRRIKMARSTESPEIKILPKKPEIVGVGFRFVEQ